MRADTNRLVGCKWIFLPVMVKNLSWEHLQGNSSKKSEKSMGEIRCVTFLLLGHETDRCA